MTPTTGRDWWATPIEQATNGLGRLALAQDTISMRDVLRMDEADRRQLKHVLKLSVLHCALRFSLILP